MEHVDWIEVAGALLGTVNIVLLVFENPWNWPIGIANNILYVIVFFSARFYSDMSLQVVYVALGIFGWYLWLHGGERRGELRVTHSPRAQFLLLLAAGAAATYAESLFLARVNDAAPLADAFTTVFSLIAMYQMTRKYLENWWLWIVVDVVSIGVYFWKHLFFTTGFYAVLLVFSMLALVQWSRSLAAARAASAA